jgi:class 3 adenylate cyclase/tetratricopeptide (TPR) repeat protein
MFCTGCGQALVPGGKFCANCGTPVAAAGQPDASVEGPPVAAAPGVAERRLVTILFADIVGSTSLGEAIDPEDLADIINGAFEVMTRAVSDAGGYIARLMGDGLLAFFGAPVAHEDDPLRAVRAALAIRDGVVAYGGTVAEQGGPRLGVRVGLDSGLVVVGQVGSDLFSEYTTMGDAANTAARLQGAAPPNEVYLSQATERLIHGAVTLEPTAPLTLKGKAEPVAAFRVAGPPPEVGTSVRGLPGVTTPLVGREGELARLVGLFDDAVSSRHGAWLTLTADAGVGKSRLMGAALEAIATRHERVTIARARAVEQDTGAPYSLLRSLLVNRYEADGTGVVAARQTVEQGLTRDLSGVPGLDAPRAAVELARLVLPDVAAGDDPRGRAERALAALMALLRALAGRAPLVLALEDLHWADEASLDAVTRMADALRDMPGFLLCNSRLDLFQRRPYWGEGEAGHVRLDLAPLTPAATGRLVAALLGGDEPVPDDVGHFIAERSEGNPYYVEELVRMLLAREVLLRDDAGWHVDQAKLEDGRVPTTLQGMLQARLDALAGLEKDGLQRASVFGRVFWSGALLALDAPDPDVVNTLRGRGLVFARERSSFPGEREFLFKHALLRDAAYTTLLKKARPPLHGAAADWLTEIVGDRYGEFAAQIARHCQEAGRTPEAATHYRAAGDRALAGYANAGAVEFYGRGLDLLPPEAATDRFACLKGRELALDMLGRRDEQRVDLDAMATLAKELNGTEASYVCFRRSWLADRTGDFATAESAALEAIELAGNDPAARADGLVNLGNARLSLERLADAREQFEEARGLRAELGDERGSAHALVGAARASEELGDNELAKDYYSTALEVYRRLDDLGGQAVTLGNLGIVLAIEGQYDAAAEHFDAALHLARATGDRTREGEALGNLGLLASEQGDVAGAEERILAALDICRVIHDKTGQARQLADLVDLYKASGKKREATDAARQLAKLQPA